ncbi:MAG: flagellar hook protein FlgE [Acidobacteria bacterium]|nr:MAG: flagellar hook protein FlgE [Acidobacteriota bacterium]
MGGSALFIGLTGLKTHSTALSTIGHNLANVNTVGFKASRTSFSDVFASGGISVNRAGASLQTGLGSNLSAVQQLFTQGSLQTTEVSTDVAIQGRGFFVLGDAQGGQGFTRAGNFSFDAEGYLVSQSGLRVLGFTSKDASGKIIPSGSLNPIQIPAGMVSPPKVTSRIRADINLDAEAQVDTTATGGTQTAEVFATSIEIYDSLGGDHQLSLVFTPVDTDGDGKLDQWNWSARLPREELAVATNPGDPDYYEIGSGTMKFDSAGQLINPADITLSTPAFANGASAQEITWVILDPDGEPVLTSYVGSSSVDNVYQDGYATGRIQNLIIDGEGVISGVFSNGQAIELAQLAIATFNNPGGLFRTGDNVYVESPGSGPPAIGTPGSGARGAVVSKALELSNVDMTEQFTNMILAERGYQANARTVTTADRVIQEALTIKR